MRIAFGAVLAVMSSRALADPSPEALELYRDGQAAFDLAHYDDAIAAWQRSYDLSKAEGLLYNLAQAYRLRARSGDCLQARQRYQLFVHQSDSSPQRTLAERYVTELETCASATVATEAPRTEPVAMPAPDVSNRRFAAIALGGAGVVMFASGIYLGAHARTLGDDVTSACGGPTGCSWATEKGKDAAGRRDTTLGYVFDAVGVAGVIGAAAYFWFGVHPREAEAVSVQLHGGGATMTWEHAW